LAPIPGYIPVYIRPGDTPLEDINPELAEAFEHYVLKKSNLPEIRKYSFNIYTKPHPPDKSTVEKDNEIDLLSNRPVKQYQHIQKIASKP
jgi:hypothetical protein